MTRFTNEYLKETSLEVKAPDTVNKDGFVAYSDNSDKATLAKFALTGVLKNQYYKDEAEAVKELLEITSKVAKTDPLFVLKASKVSRDANMKLFPKLALAAVLAETSGDTALARLVNETATKVLSTYNPNQLLEFVLTMKEKQFSKGLGSRTQKIVANALGRMKNERLENQTIAEADSLQRILRLVHPKLDNMVKYVLDKKEGTENGLPVTAKQKAMEQLKELASGPDREKNEKAIASLIREYKLPFNAIKGIVGGLSETVWDAVADEMSVLQLLINLRSLDSKNSMSPAKLRKLIDRKLDDKTRLLPFDVMRPYAHADERFKDVLSQLVDKLSNIEIPGLADKKVAVFIDASGSMGGPYNASSPWMNSVALSLPFITNCTDREIIMFDTRLHFEGQGKLPKFKVGEGQDNFNKLAKAFSNGGTDVGMCIQYLLDKKVFRDVVVLITDEQQNTGNPVYQLWKKYQKSVNKNASLLVINPTNYAWGAVPKDDPSVTVVNTLTPSIYKMISYHGKNLVEAIEETEL